ncbi:MAG: guanylate kinase [Anaerolineales bacterium]
MVYDSFERIHIPLLIILSGTAGSGKDSVVRRMMERGVPFEFVVNLTSRPPRPGEIDGRDYRFVSDADFAEMIRKDELLEHAVVYGQFKGVPKRPVREAMESGKDVILRVDIQGAATVRRQCPGAVSIFLTAASPEELKRRLVARGADSAEQVELRLRTASEEMKRVPEFDYCVVNADGRLEEAVDSIISIIRAEHCRTSPRKAVL